MKYAAEYMFNYLRDVLFATPDATLNMEELPEDFRELGEGLLYAGQCIMETKELARALSRGELQGKLPASDNEMAAPLKALHSSLRHLTWQSEQVAKGDYKQRVEFMGDFAVAFNSMVEQLERRRTALMEEIESSRKKSKALENSNDLLAAITNQLPQWVIVIDRETGNRLFTNRPEPSMLTTKLMNEKLRIWLEREARRVGEQTLHEEVEVTDGGILMNFSATSYPLQWHGNNAVAFVLSDITREKKRLRDLENVAYRDMATQAYNRHYGMKTLNEWLDGHKRFVICFADIDRLKYVNDTFGHAEGDAYIMCVVNALKEFSPDALVCRLGGDEFMLLAENWDLIDAKSRLEHMRNYLTRHNDEQESKYDRSISYGVIAVNESNHRSASELLFMADEKMYVHKRANKAQRQA